MATLAKMANPPADSTLIALWVGSIAGAVLALWATIRASIASIKWLAHLHTVFATITEIAQDAKETVEGRRADAGRIERMENSIGLALATVETISLRQAAATTEHRSTTERLDAYIALSSADRAVLHQKIDSLTPGLGARVTALGARVDALDSNSSTTGTP